MPQEQNTSNKGLRRIQGQRVLASTDSKPSTNRSLLGTSPPSLPMGEGKYPFCEMINWPQTSDLEGSSHQLVDKQHHITPSVKMALFNIDKSSSTEIFPRFKSVFCPLSSNIQKFVIKLQNFESVHIKQVILGRVAKSKRFELSRTRKAIYRRNQRELTGIPPNAPSKYLEEKLPNKPKLSPEPVYPSQLPRVLYLVDEVLPQGAPQSNPTSISDLPAAYQAEVWKEKFEKERKILEKKQNSFDEFRFAKNAELDVERARAHYYQQRFETELAKNALQQQPAKILSQEEHPPTNMYQPEALNPENTTNAGFELDSSDIEGLFAVSKGSPQPQSPNSIPMLSTDTLRPLRLLKWKTVNYSMNDKQVEDLITFPEEDSLSEVIPEVSSHGTNKYPETAPAKSESSVESLPETPTQSLPGSKDNQEQEEEQVLNSERNNTVRQLGRSDRVRNYTDLQPRSNGYMLFAWEEWNFAPGLPTDLEADIQRRKNKRRGVVFPSDFQLEEF